MGCKPIYRDGVLEATEHGITSLGLAAELDTTPRRAIELLRYYVSLGLVKADGVVTSTRRGRPRIIFRRAQGA